MIFKLPTNFRVWHAEKLLSWAERKTIPNKSGTNVTRRFGRLSSIINAIQSPLLTYYATITTLKIIREGQRQSSESTHELTRPSEGTNINFLYFRLIEIFHIEDFSNLKEGLLKLFPDLQSDWNEIDFKTEFDSATTHGTGTWRRLGIIYRKPASYPSEPRASLPNLPSVVDHISVEWHKPLSSIFIVTFDVHLTKEATRQLINLQEEPYFEEIRFEKFIPWSPYRMGHSMGSSGTKMQEEITSWFANLRGEVEKCISPYVSGYFARQRTDSSANQVVSLPSIEVFALNGVKGNSDSFEQWKKDAGHWWNSLGFKFHSNVYMNNLLVFAFPNESTRQERKGGFYTAYRFASLWEDFILTIDTKNYQHLEEDKFESVQRNFAKEEIKEWLNKILPLIALRELTNSIHRNIQKFKQEVFRGNDTRLKRYIELCYVLQKEESLFNRIKLEFEQYENWILSEKVTEFENKAELRRFNDDQLAKDKKTSKKKDKLVDEIETPKFNLKDNGLDGIKYKLETIETELKYLATTHNSNLTTRNMDAMYRLQGSIWWMTIIVVLATIIGVAATIFFGITNSKGK